MKNKLIKQLKKIGYDSYSRYLESNYWKSFRKKVFFNNKYLCSICGKNKKLNIHHKTYKRLGKERLKDVMLVCEDCHEGIHDLHKFGKKVFKKSLWKASMSYKYLYDKPGKGISRSKRESVKFRNEHAEDIQNKETAFLKAKALAKQNK